MKAPFVHLADGARMRYDGGYGGRASFEIWPREGTREAVITRHDFERAVLAVLAYPPTTWPLTAALPTTDPEEE